MAPSRVKEVMFSEWNLHMRKGMNETFVLEVPLLTEVFTDTENVKRQAELRGHVTGPSMTLWSGFDFRRRHDRDRALAVVREKKPYFVMIAFPCGPWSPLQHLRAGPDLLRAKQAEGRVLIRFAVALAEEQARGGRHFIIENPDLSTAWRQLRLQKLLRQFLSVRLDQCCFGLRGPGGGLHKKPTRLLTSSQAVVSRFQGARCNGQHQHEHVIGGGKITEAAGHYTKSFAKAVVEAMENQFDYETRCSSESRKVSECYVVLADGSLELEHEVLAADNAEQPDDFDFEAASEDDEIVAQDVKVEISPAVRAADRRIHEATGHRSNRRLARALIVSGAPLEAVMAAKTLKCAVCEERKAPKARRPASLPPPLQVGEQVHLDLVVVEDALGQPFVVAHATDAVSKYQLAELLPDKTSESVIKFLTRLWWPILGAPRVIVADQGREFISQTFSDFCESRSTLLWHCAVQAPWMNGTAERSGGILKTLVTHMVAEKSITGAEEMAAVVAEAAEGVSPLQAVTGRQPAAEGSVLHNFHGRLSEHGLIDTSPTLTWRMALRESARVGMVRLHYSQTIRKAELARSREPTTRSLPVPGDVCFFFRQQKVNPKKGDPRTSTSSSRRRVELKRWHGPAILVALEGGSGGVPGSAFLSYRGQLTKCSVEHIRKASSLEQLAAGTWEEAIKEIIDTSVVQQGFEDSSARERPSGVPDDEMEVIPEEEALLRGMPLVVGVHPGEEARQEQIPSPGTPQTSSTTSSLTAAPGTPVGQLFDRPVIQQALTRARQAPLLENIQQAALRRGQPSDFQEELRQAMVRGRKRSASDLEAAREMQPAAGAEASGISDGLGPSVAEASGSASSTAGSPLTADVAQTSTSSRSPTNPPSVAPAATNEVNQTNLRIPFEALTMTREELENMAAGEDVHPLMKVQAMVEMDRQHPSTLFDREPDHGSWDGRWSMPGRTQWELFEKLGLDWPKGSSAEHSVEAATARKEMVWSKLGASQRKLWEAAAVKGWRAYTDNQAVQVLSEQETQRVKRDLARKGELDKILKPRWVMTDKAEGLRTATNPLPPEPSARLVVPGFKDRANLSGELRRDAPTGSRLAQHFLLSLLAWHSSTWSLYSADIKSAFLKGDPYLDRDLFLSNTDERAGPPIPGLPRGRLARVLKGIFGLADAPRRWWQRLSRSMETRKWIRSTIDQATWMLRDDSNNIIGIVVAHVDDLLFAGGSEAEQSLRSVGEELGFRELTKDKFTWCGKQFEKRGDGCVYLSMRAYHDNLKPIPVSSHRKGDLSAPLTSFEARQLRALLGSYQWLVTQLRFDMAFVVSSLQGETPTVGTLMRANAALVEFQKLRDFELRFQPVNPYTGGLMVVTDSALGNVMASGSATGAPLEKVFSQACYFVLLADEDLMQGRQGRFNIVDARSHRLARVCRSSYAAETLGAEEGFDVGQLCRGFLATVRGDSLHKQSVDQSLNAVPLTVVVDAKDVFDKASSDTSSFGSQKSLAFTIAWLRQILRRPNTSIRWTSTENMWADAGTKEMDLTHMRKIIRTGSWSVTYSPVFVKQVSKAKKRPAQASTPEDALPGKPVHGTDPILGHLMALCEERGWHSVGGMGVNVAFSARPGPVLISTGRGLREALDQTPPKQNQLRYPPRGSPRNLLYLNGHYLQQYVLYNHNEAVSSGASPLWKLGPLVPCQLYPRRRYPTLLLTHNTDLYAHKLTYMQLDVTNLYLMRENHNLPNHSWPMRGRPEEVQRHMEQLLRKAANPTPPIPALNSSRRMTLHTETIFAMGQCQSQPRQKPTTKGTHPFQNSRNPTYGHCLNHYLLDGTATVATTRGSTPRSTSLRMVRAEKVTSRLMVQSSELQEDGEDCPQAWEKREERGEDPDSSDEPDEDHNAAAGRHSELPTEAIGSNKGRWGRGPKTKLGGRARRSMDLVHENATSENFGGK
ncbi:Copia protein [Symbiodinium microadriaticum]|uniref:Copia protein n=1 Tax=Symbiodinium microadriaticum TaxID=2951 RepID=A0A1Q9C9Z4_SYMMI|nr:Copia protein [Symbiodinium microadriaticum]